MSSATVSNSPEGSRVMKNRYKLATRFRNINIVFIVLILTITIVVCGYLLYNFADSASVDYVRFYTLDSVDIFSSHLSRELLLVEHISQLPELTEWFADEENLERKEAAFREMMSYADSLQIGGLYFGIVGSNNEYSIDSDASFNQLAPFNVLSADNPYDIWFFNAAGSYFDFTLHMDVCKVTNTRRLWINHKVMHEGRTVGVICSALQFDDIFIDLFGHYEGRNVKGFVIDHRGIIQIDSTVPEPVLESDHSGYTSQERHILTINSYDAFIYAINNYQKNPMIFYGRTEPEVIRLPDGDYRYLSIAPVPNTNWLIVTFFSPEALFDVMSILPMVSVVALAFLIFVVVNSILIRRLLFSPLNKLAVSVSTSDRDDSAIYGVDRKDEIGDLARTTQEVWRRLHDMAISLQKTAQIADAANESKSFFLANMSHEIRTPMNSIIGFSELAMDNNLPPKVEDYIENIRENSEYLLQIVNDILDISKIESGKIELENIPFSLSSIVNACRTIILPRAISKGLTMHFYAEPSVGKRLYGDPTRLRQVFINLLSNAVKFTNSGMIKMNAVVKDIGTDNVTMCFEVKDSGIGISPEQIERIFDPFMQAESGTTRKFGGSGLGLTITKNLVALMGGELKIESTPDVGSKFSFEIIFDAVDVDSDSNMSEKIVFDDLEKPEFNAEVLLCEDNLMNQQVISEHLARVGVRTVIAQNGQIGVDMVKNRIESGEKQFEMIFMDMHMPVMDGIEAAEAINELNTGIPIVAMTANIMTSEKDHYERHGMSGYVGKPFKSQELWHCLMSFLEPVSWQSNDESQYRHADNELRQKLINRFFETNNYKFDEIRKALDDEDIELAHRLVHTLKGNAGQLSKTLLQQAAEDVERNLVGGVNKTNQQQLDVLQMELNVVLNELAPMVQIMRSEKKVPDIMSPAAAHELLDQVQKLLEDQDIECLSFVNDIEAIPGSEELIGHIESFDYEPALESLVALRNSL